MAEHGPAEPTLIACPACGGRGQKKAPCACRHNGNTFLVSGGILLSDAEPYADCELCDGTGETTVMCFPCRQGGSVRAQGVVSVVNAVTGQTASVQIVPGAFDPVPWEPRPSRRVIDVAAIVRELADQVGVAVLFDMLDRPLADEDLAMPIFLPESWRDDAAPGQRSADDPIATPEPAVSHPAGSRAAADAGPSVLPSDQVAVEEAAIGEWAGRRRWHLYVGYPAGVRRRPDPERGLTELRTVADAARLDLVIRLIDRTWSVAYEVPGARPRPGQAWYSGAQSLSEAINAVSPSELVEHAKTVTTADGHWVVSTPPAEPHHNTTWHLAELRWAITTAADGVPGASATWRDGRWYIRALTIVEQRELLSTQQTGQVRSTIERVTERAEPIPRPRWQGQAMPTQRCARCISGVAWRECSCTFLDDVPTPDCPRCSGVGRAPDPYCSGCDDTRLVHLGAVVTLVGPDARGVTANLRLGPSPDVEFFVNDHGVRCARVPRELTAAAWAETFGTDPDWLCNHGIRSIGVLARDGVFATELTDPREVVAEYLARLTTGRPGGRLVYFVRPPGDAPIASLLRVVHGVDARMEVAVAVDPHGGLRWGLAVAHRGAPSRYAPPEVDLTLGDAVGRVMTSLPQRLGAIEHDVTRTETLRPPHHGRAVEVEPGIEAMLRDVTTRHDRLLAYATRSGWTLHAWTHRSWVRIGAGATLREAVVRTRQS